MTIRGQQAFDPYLPRGDIDVQRFATDITRLLNRTHRNEVPVNIQIEDALPSYFPMVVAGMLGSTHSAKHTAAGWSPYYEGFTLRRVRLVKAGSLARTGGGPNAIIRALLATSVGVVVVGTYDSMTDGLRAYTPRIISGNGDLNRVIPAGATLSYEIEQIGWPKQSMRDCILIFDVFVT